MLVCLSQSFRKLPTKLISPVSNRFMTSINTSLMQNTLYIEKAKRKTNIVHHRKFDNFWASSIIFEYIFLFSFNYLAHDLD